MRQFTIEFNDLGFAKQDELIQAIASDILEDWFTEAEQHRAEYPQKTSWEEIVCRLYDFDSHYWEEQPIGINSYDWKSIIAEFSETQAQEKVEQAIHDITFIVI